MTHFKIKGLVERKKLSKARVIVTSRPSAANNLHDHVDKKVELIELAKSAKNEVLSVLLNNSPCELKMLKDHLCRYCDMDILTDIPVYLTIMVWLSLRKCLPCTITEMNEVFILHTLNHHLKVNGVVSDFIEIEQLKNFIDLNRLERFAFESLIRDKPIFLATDLFNNIGDPMCYGLMQSTQRYNPSLPHSGWNVILKFYPGIQEYLAAKYVSGLPIEVMLELFQSLASAPVPADLRMQLFDMWVFIFSTINMTNRRILFSEVLQSFDLVENKTVSFSQKSLPCTEISKVAVLNGTDQAYLNILNLLQFFQGLDEFGAILYQTFADNGIVDYAYCNLLPYQIVSLGLLLSKYFVSIAVLNLTNCYIGDYGLSVLHKYLNKSNQQISTLNVGGNNLTAGSSSLICDLINCVKPYLLELSCNYLMDSGIGDICIGVVKSESIKELYVADNEISYLGSIALSDIMKYLWILYVSYNNIIL